MNVSLRGPCVLRLVRNLKGSCDAKGLVVGSIAYRQAQTRYFNLVIVGTILYIYMQREICLQIHCYSTTVNLVFSSIHLLLFFQNFYTNYSFNSFSLVF